MNALIRYADPLSNMLDEFFNTDYARADRDISLTHWPRVDIVEEEDAYLLRADIPGMEKSDIKVEVEKGVLTIHGEKKEEKRERKRDRFYHFERSYGSFRRSFNLPENVDSTKINATYKNGILELTLKKSEESKPKAIEVKVQ
jgi:HSP20 family protein